MQAGISSDYRYLDSTLKYGSHEYNRQITNANEYSLDTTNPSERSSLDTTDISEYSCPHTNISEYSRRGTGYKYSHVKKLIFPPVPGGGIHRLMIDKESIKYITFASTCN